MLNPKIITSLILVIGLAAGFGGGYYYRNQQLGMLRGNFPGMQNGNPQRFNGMPGIGQGGTSLSRSINGEVISIEKDTNGENKSITLKIMDGSSKIVLFSESTTFLNTVPSSKTDLKDNIYVSIVGTPNSDGSITAGNVQLNSQFGRMLQSPTPKLTQ